MLNRINVKLPSIASIKHFVHCLLFIFIIIYYQVTSGAISSQWFPQYRQHREQNEYLFEQFKNQYGYFPAYTLYTCNLFVLFLLPYSICLFLGLTLFNAFNKEVKLNESVDPAKLPFICIRTVTKGHYPDLIRRNVVRNIDTCLSVGMVNFCVEVVTDIAINLPQKTFLKETVVPDNYNTKSGALFKARALQFCLDQENNWLSDNDYIVHLDEETILTRECMFGIMNFIAEGKHAFGQGAITYTNEEIHNWMTTIADVSRLGYDYGVLRWQFKTIHRPLFGWKGSFMVAKLSAERDVSFDHGPDGSVTEDIHFAMIGDKLGYTFDFIEGEMWEKSPFSIYDFYQQRKRWFQGLNLVVHTSLDKIPLRSKALLLITNLLIFTSPLITISMVFSIFFFPIPMHDIVNVAYTFVVSTRIYNRIFGFIKSFTLRNLFSNPKELVYCLICYIFSIPFSMLIENTALIIGLITTKHQFFIVVKYQDIQEKREIVAIKDK